MKILNYRVKSQEDIKSICKYFNISTEQFNLNNTCKSVEQGSVVKILLKQKCIVLPGDTIQTLAKKLQVQCCTLKEKFGEKFFIGEILEL